MHHTIITMSDLRHLQVNDHHAIAFRYDVPAISEPEEDTEGENNQKPRFLATRPLPEEDKPEKPLVLMIHDFPQGSHMRAFEDLYGTLSDQLTQKGFSTLRFDCRHCGSSDGRQENFSMETALKDLKAVMQWARKKQGHKKFMIVAAGLGAALSVLAYHPRYMNGMVFLWPVLEPMKTPLNVIDTLEGRSALADNDYVIIGKDNRLGLLLANELRQLDLSRRLQSIKAYIQIHHGTADDYYAYEDMRMATAQVPGLKDLSLFEDGEHFLPDQEMRQTVIQNTVFFIEKYGHRKPPAFLTYLDEHPIFRSQ